MSQDFPFKHFFKTIPEEGRKNVKEIKLDELFNTKKSKNLSAVMPSVSAEMSDSEINMLQSEIHSILESTVSHDKYEAFFKGNLKIHSVSQGVITFHVTTPFLKNFIETNYKEFIHSAIKETLGREYSVNIELLSAETKTTVDEVNSKRRKVSEMSFTLKNIEEPRVEALEHSKNSILEKKLNTFNPDEAKTFDNFVMGPSNNMAYAFAMSVAKEPGKVYPSLFIYGNSGLGKTHLLHAVANFVQEKEPDQRILILSANTFMKEMVRSIQNNDINDFRKRFTEHVDILIIDDIHELKKKEGTQREFFHVFNELHNNGKQLIFTSDKHPKEIDGIEDRIKTRLSSALSVEIQQPDLETRIAILKKKAMEKDLYLDDEVINLIARCIKTNIRELEGSLVKLGAYSSILNVDIDIEIAKEQLKLSEELEQKVVNIDSITRTVANYFKLNLGDIRGKSRIKEITKARHIAMYLSHQLLKTTLQGIGEYFSHRDHTSVMHGIKKIKKDIKDNQQISQIVYEIESQL